MDPLLVNGSQKGRASTGKSRQEAYVSIASTTESTSDCRPASAMGTEARLEKIFSDSGTCCWCHNAAPASVQSWNFHRTSDSYPCAGILWPSLLPSWVLLRTVWISLLCSAGIGGTDAGHVATGGIIEIRITEGSRSLRPRSASLMY